mgnify:CR=1 FL=1
MALRLHGFQDASAISLDGTGTNPNLQIHSVDSAKYSCTGTMDMDTVLSQPDVTHPLALRIVVKLISVVASQPGGAGGVRLFYAAVTGAAEDQLPDSISTTAVQNTALVAANGTLAGWAEIMLLPFGAGVASATTKYFSADVGSLPRKFALLIANTTTAVTNADTTQRASIRGLYQQTEYNVPSGGVALL